MARKNTLAEAQKTLTSYFPLDYVVLRSYAGAAAPGVIELPDGSRLNFPHFGNLKRFKTLDEAVRFLRSHPLNAQISSPPPTVNISVTGDQNTTLHNSPHTSVDSQLKPQSPEIKAQILLTKYEDLKAYLSSPELQEALTVQQQAVLTYALAGLGSAIDAVVSSPS